MILSNVHTHTSFSHGRDSAEEMVMAALQRGFTSLGFSEHGAAPHEDSVAMPDEAAYVKEILRLKKKYADRIEIALGYEHESVMPPVNPNPYEYQIESTHYVPRWLTNSIDHSADMLETILNTAYSGDAYEMVRDYYGLVCSSLQTTKADVLGHFDLITKFQEVHPLFDTADPRYTAPALEAARFAVEKDILIEINTGAMSRGYRSAPYPAPELLRFIKEHGGRITITSDCHRSDWINFAFDQAEALAKDCGFTETWIWKDGRFQPVAL